MEGSEQVTEASRAKRRQLEMDLGEKARIPPTGVPQGLYCCSHGVGSGESSGSGDGDEGGDGGDKGGGCGEDGEGDDDSSGYSGDGDKVVGECYHGDKVDEDDSGSSGCGGGSCDKGGGQGGGGYPGHEDMVMVTVVAMGRGVVGGGDENDAEGVVWMVRVMVVMLVVRVTVRLAVVKDLLRNEKRSTVHITNA